ncbi:hypothetical protein ABBQ38_010235 [Trebouxia sp. C0009 RCD-2024]
MWSVSKKGAHHRCCNRCLLEVSGSDLTAYTGSLTDTAEAAAKQRRADERASQTFQRAKPAIQNLGNKGMMVKQHVVSRAGKGNLQVNVAMADALDKCVSEQQAHVKGSFINRRPCYYAA